MDGQPVEILEGRTRLSRIWHSGDGYFYHAREVRHLRVRLVCRNKSRGRRCPGIAVVSLATGIFNHRSPHLHLPDLLLPEDLAMRRFIIEEASRNVQGRRIRSILDDFQRSINNPALAMRFTRVRMCSALYAARSMNYPAIPRSLLHLGVLLGTPELRQLCQTVDGADHLYRGVIGCERLRTVAVVFASGRMLDFLQTRRSIHVDGTFRKRAKKPNSSQIFNIVAKHGDNVVAIVRVLMLSRTQAAYTEVLNFLKILAPGFHPTRVHCDFERALMNAFRLAFPLCRIVGCLWHYAVCVGLKTRNLGLAPLARANPLIMSFISRLCAVPLLPHHLLWHGVVEVWREVELSGWSDRLRPLFAYWEMEWKPRAAELSVYGDPDRTNNCSESDNRMLANVIPQNSPNIWFLIGGFVRLEYLAWCDKLAIDDLRPVAPGRRFCTIANDRRVERASEMLQNGHLTPGEFLHSLSYAVRSAGNNGLLIDNDIAHEDGL